MCQPKRLASAFNSRRALSSGSPALRDGVIFLGHGPSLASDAPIRRESDVLAVSIGNREGNG